jgi:enoyl-[acyl-carrier protein] reductase III
MFNVDFMKGKVALVTGASRGIGRGIALALAETGADIIVHYARKAGLANDVVAEVQSMGRRAIAIKANFAEKEKIDAMLDEIEDIFGGCDIFVANAATGGFRPMLETSDKHWDWTMMSTHVPFSIVFNVSRHIWSVRRGRVVTVTSLGESGRSHYSAVGLSKSVVESSQDISPPNWPPKELCQCHLTRSCGD